ncbi:MAG: pantoate--beta-alanine ligase [Solirubrobacteraceae bacterium]
MRTLRTVAELRAALAGPRHAGRVIGLVPTMGAFHDGHLSLMARARQECDEVVVSLFVNPTQFEDPADLAGYRRDEHEDARLAAAMGADHLFAPAREQVYPPGFATSVSVGAMSERLEGAQRGRRHFDGVSTVVTKLLNMVAPQVAYFGQKDVQQTIVIKRLVRDLDLPVRIEVCPTVREPDGLAMSSRNVRLSAAERTRAESLHRALRAVQAAVAAGARDPAAARAGGVEELARAGVTPEYLELVTADTLVPVERIEGNVLAVLAATVGSTRLIDNEMIRVRPSAHAVANHERREALTCSARC